MLFGSRAVSLAYGSWLVVITLISLHQNRPGGMRVAIESAAPGFARVPGVLQIPGQILLIQAPGALRIPPGRALRIGQRAGRIGQGLKFCLVFRLIFDLIFEVVFVSFWAPFWNLKSSKMPPSCDPKSSLEICVSNFRFRVIVLTIVVPPGSSKVK